MLDTLSRLMGGMPIAGVVALLTLGVVQLSLQIFGLFDLSRREHVQGGKKWVWIVVVVLGGLIGAIVYLAIGRRVDEDWTTAGQGHDLAARRGAPRETIDRLYGNRRDQ